MSAEFGFITLAFYAFWSLLTGIDCFWNLGNFYNV